MKRARLVVVLATIIVGGCGPTPAATMSPPTNQSPAASSSETASQGVVLRSGAIDQKTTTPALDYRSTGEWLLWSTGARAPGARESDVAPDLLGARPGSAAVVLYDNPNRDSRLEVVGGLGERFAFIEINARVFGLGAWRLWYLPAPGATSVLVDRGGGGQLPFFAMSPTTLVWTRADAGSGSTATSTIKSYDLASGRQRTVVSAPARSMQYWFPALDGNHLVFGTVELAADALSDQRHVYLLDLSNGTDQPIRLDSSTSASQPAIRGDTVIWKESDPSLNFLVDGQLVRHSLATSVTEPIALPTAGALGFTFPSIGTNFATAWPQSDRSIYLVDLARRTYPALIDLGSTDEAPHEAVARPHIAGGLLAYVYGPPNGDLELRWAILR